MRVRKSKKGFDVFSKNGIFRISSLFEWKWRKNFSCSKETWTWIESVRRCKNPIPFSRWLMWWFIVPKWVIFSDYQPMFDIFNMNHSKFKRNVWTGKSEPTAPGSTYQNLRSSACSPESKNGPIEDFCKRDPQASKIDFPTKSHFKNRYPAESNLMKVSVSKRQLILRDTICHLRLPERSRSVSSHFVNKRNWKNYNNCNES